MAQAASAPLSADSVKVFLAGSDNTRERTNQIMRNNFRGTIDKVHLGFYVDRNKISSDFIKYIRLIYGNIYVSYENIDVENIYFGMKIYTSNTKIYLGDMQYIFQRRVCIR